MGHWTPVWKTEMLHYCPSLWPPHAYKGYIICRIDIGCTSCCAELSNKDVINRVTGLKNIICIISQKMKPDKSPYFLVKNAKLHKRGSQNKSRLNKIQKDITHSLFQIYFVSQLQIAGCERRESASGSENTQERQPVRGKQDFPLAMASWLVYLLTGWGGLVGGEGEHMVC